MGIYGATEILLILLVLAGTVLLPLFALIDILRSKFGGNDAIMMILIVIFVPVVGPILYFIMGPARKIKKE
jgi:uncharacterized PurR-regulated membrane protein YhhQ (DUF165 family)